MRGFVRTRTQAKGKGIGKAITKFAIHELKVNEVDVNEGNTNGVEFYKHFGFEQYDRTPIDSTGKPYPILMMRLI